MYQVRKKYEGDETACYQIGQRRFSAKNVGVIIYPTKEEADKAASEAGAGAYVEEVPAGRYNRCRTYESLSRWNVDIYDEKSAQREASISADTEEEADQRGEWLLKCMNDHAHIFQP